MNTTALLISLALQAQTADKPSVKYYQQDFTVSIRGVETHVPLAEPKTTPPKFVAYRKDRAFAVWDERGLTVRRDKKAVSTHLADIATSPKVFSRDEILKTIKRIKDGDVSKDATALSGSKRLGKYAFFLVRWEDKNGKPWSEALVQVDLTATTLKPELLGRFDGLSLATKLVDDRLEILSGKLAIIERSSDSWGVATYDPVTQVFQTQPIGGTLKSFEMISPTQGLFVETSSYGTTIAGRVDLAGGTRKILYEGREQVHFVDSASPEVVLAIRGTKTDAINCVTGAVRSIPFVVSARRIDKNVLFWTPSDAPKAVWLMSPAHWDTLATWRER